MPQLIVATTATAEPMGAQAYEREVARLAPQALPDWRVSAQRFRSMRSPVAGDRRVPAGWLAAASPWARRAFARTVYPYGAVVHRSDLVLPPSPYSDVVTLHDVVAWRFDDEAAPARAARSEVLAAAAVICVSSFTAQEAVDLLGVRDPVVVHNGIDASFFDAEALTVDERRELGLGPRYVLHAGGTARRKNLDGLADAWDVVRRADPGLELALAGPASETRFRLFAGKENVRFLGRVADALMPRLFASAAAVVVPSTYEGFGLPAIEAMAAGAPLVAAACAALPEVVGDGGLLVRPDGPAIAEGILAATAGGAEVSAMVARGRARADRFTWERSVAAHAQVWRSVAAGRAVRAG